MTDKQTFITKEGLLRLQAELELKTHKRRELADRIREAKELGDLRKTQNTFKQKKSRRL